MSLMTLQRKFQKKLCDWRHTARSGFGLQKCTVSQLEYDYRTASECAFQAYEKWKMEKLGVDHVSVQKLLETLHKPREHEAINFLVEEIKKLTRS